MRAIVIREPGGPEVLVPRELPDPTTPPGHVRVRVGAVGVNRADVLQRMGLYPAPLGVPSDVPGLELAGTVDVVGQGVTLHRPGDRVMGLVAGGAYAELVVLHERELVRTPEGLGDVEAAALPEAFVTAYDALVRRGRLAASDWVLVHAVGSGVGTAAVQLAKALGARVVGTSRSPAKLERAAALGLDAGVVPEVGSDGVPRFEARVRELTGRGVDVAIDLLGGAYLAETMACCAPRGRVVSVGLTAGTRAELDLRILLTRRLELVGTVLRSRPLEEKIEAAHDLARIGGLVRAGRVAPIVFRELPLEEAATAHRLLEANDPFGKVVLRVTAA